MANEQSGLPSRLFDTVEGRRVHDAASARPWRSWGPYLSERQWGTVREDYSPNGDAWNYLSFEEGRSRAYRWGEDGIAGFADRHLRWCLALALWNGKDPILKERLFGLTNSEGNHGEDVKELYYYTDGVPSHAYMRMVYKYPQAEFPYDQLRKENARRGPKDPEFELIDTGVFAQNRYFDVTVEYAKAAGDDILMRVTVENRGPDAAPIHVLPHFWARNIWSWEKDAPKPALSLSAAGVVDATHPELPPLRLYVDGAPEILFCENVTNTVRLYGEVTPGPFKDGINDCVVGGDRAAVSLTGGTKCAAHFAFTLGAGEKRVLRLRLRPTPVADTAFDDFDTVFDHRIAETEEFYAVLQCDMADPDRRLVQRQALAGMLWSKQYYRLDIRQWLSGDPTYPPPPPERLKGRNAGWVHLYNADVITMPDTWEYPWYAAWDLAFHCVTFALIDPEFAKAQLVLMTREWYMHPNGQLPAYEWKFDDVNPPVHAWATWRVYEMDMALRGGSGDRVFLERVFHKLLLNFNWWVNRKDASGRNVFQGGFLGLDNIGIFDRSSPLPTGGSISQSDGTAWMAMYALNLMRIALELARANHVYEDIASKFFEHFLYIAEAMTRMGGEHGLWDEQDEFFYDVLELPNGKSIPLRVRSMVGLIPLYAVQVLNSEHFTTLPGFNTRLQWFLNHRPDLASLVSRWTEAAQGERHLLSLLRGHRVKRLLARALDEAEFFSDFGVRALSRVHAAAPYTFHFGGKTFAVDYEPGESTNRLFGGNSNWRGPIWMPVNYLLVESLYEFHHYYGDDFLVECPVGSGRMMSLRQVADEISQRLCALFLRDHDGRRPVFGDNEIAQTDPAFRDNVLFHEYFHGDTGKGLGASHQTGWTGAIALLLHPRHADDPCIPAVK